MVKSDVLTSLKSLSSNESVEILEFQHRLSSNIGIDFEPVSRSKPIQQILRPKEKNPACFS